MLISTLVRTAVLLIAAGVLAVAQTPGRREISGIYPHLAMFNGGNECGTGAVVPWADRLWVVTYAPHQPLGSADKLYEITPALNQIIRPESIGGTPANRMIHRESGQLFIGPYAIDARARVRVIPYATMSGRPTGNARHLTVRPTRSTSPRWRKGSTRWTCTRSASGAVRGRERGAAPEGCRRHRRPAPARLPRQGALLRPGPARLREQRRARRRGAAARTRRRAASRSGTARAGRSCAATSSPR